MTDLTCPGLPGTWINGWLAAVGATVLDARIRLHWTTHGAPLAVFSAAEVDPVTALVESWPDAALLSGLPIAKSWKGAGDVQRKVPVEAFAARARAARGHPYCWTLSSTMTDLCVDEHGEVAHAPFDPAGPGTIKWLHHRLMKVHEHVEPAAGRLRDSLTGQAVRVEEVASHPVSIVRQRHRGYAQHSGQDRGRGKQAVSRGGSEHRERRSSL